MNRMIRLFYSIYLVIDFMFKYISQLLSDSRFKSDIKTFTTVVLLLYLISGCQNNPDDLIDYDKLRKLEVDKVLEFGESEGYVPGELGDLVLVSDNTILVSDWGTTTIEQFSTGGEHVGTVATEGRGPGELPSFFMLNKGTNDTLLVVHGGMSRRVDYFTRGGDGIYRYVRTHIRENLKDRFATIIGPSPDTAYYAKTRGNSGNRQQWFADHPEYYWSPIILLDNSFDHILKDSLHLLKKTVPLIELSEGGAMTYLGIPPYQSLDLFRLMDSGRYLIARSDSSALYVYNRDHSLNRKIPLRVRERPVEQADLDYQFELRNTDSEVRSKMESRIPGTKPPFHNVWVSENHIWLHTDTRKEGKQIVALSLEGAPVGVFYLSAYDDIRYFRGERIYVLHKNPKAGHSIRIYQIDL